MAQCAVRERVGGARERVEEGTTHASRSNDKGVAHHVSHVDDKGVAHCERVSNKTEEPSGDEGGRERPGEQRGRTVMARRRGAGVRVVRTQTRDMLQNLVRRGDGEEGEEDIDYGGLAEELNVK